MAFNTVQAPPSLNPWHDDSTSFELETGRKTTDDSGKVEMFSFPGRRRFIPLPSYPGFIFLSRPTFLHMNTLVRTAGLTQSKRDNQSMRKLCCPAWEGDPLFFINRAPAATAGNLRWRRFRADGNFDRTWRHDLCNIAHALAHHVAVLAPVGDVKLACLALWREREYLTFISIRFVAFSNQNFADYRS